ncbi:DUF257 family protein [Pyrococcus horikoshii]|nr:DUF257 family protein [Pyrococcus horikoshii]HII61774.1 DUF257 family protein [Pyrococcus horikoshii]
MEISEVIGKEKISVLVEYTSDDIIGPTLFAMLNKIRETYREDALIIITDFLDTLPICRYHAELIGVRTEVIDKSAIIKVGGKINSGNVLYKIPISSYPVYKTLYEETLEKVLESVDTHRGFFVNVQIGIENLMNIFEKKELIEQIHDIGEYIVTKNKDIRDLVFINVESLRNTSIEVLSLLRTIFPVVVKLMNNGRSFVVEKSVLPSLRGSVGTIW